MAYIKVENLKYRYPNTKKLALDDLNFEIEKGSFIGIAGANGAGKSTLCQAFNGLVPGFFKGAYGGRVIIDGEETAKVPVSRLCQKVGLVFQNPFNQLSGAKETVFEEIAFGLQNFGVPADEMIKRVNEVMDLLDIAEYKWRNPFDLSGGQMQRVALAGILAMKPDVIATARNMQYDCCGRIGCSCYKNLPMQPVGDSRHRYFLRFLVEDRTGILAGVAGVLGNNGVSISQVIQKPAIDGVAELVVITDKVETRHLQDALVIFGEMSMIREVASVIRVYSQK